jgi:hypothetical protein
MEFPHENTAPYDLGTLLFGESIVLGQVTDVGRDPDIPDEEQGFNGTADVFTFSIPLGGFVDSIVLRTIPKEVLGTESDVPGFDSSSEAMFMAIDEGPTFRYSAAEINAFETPLETDELRQELFGFGVVGFADIDKNILRESTAEDPNGFYYDDPQLGPGPYTVYLQETGVFSNYNLAFSVTAIPEPNQLAPLGGMLLVSAAVVRIRARHHKRRGKVQA